MNSVLAPVGDNPLGTGSNDLGTLSRLGWHLARKCSAPVGKDQFETGDLGLTSTRAAENRSAEEAGELLVAGLDYIVIDVESRRSLGMAETAATVVTSDPAAIATLAL
jgi:hypothetical protein